MLGKLVNKFKKHSLNEEAPHTGENVNPLEPYRRNTHALYDSGTESDDDDLDTMSIASIEMREIMANCPPLLTSSPPLVNEFDTNSWDSTGGESGIVVREFSEEPGDSSRDSIPENPPNFMSSCASLYVGDTGRIEGVEAAGGRTLVDSGKSKTGAFRPVVRRRCAHEDNQDTGNVALNTQVLPPFAQGLIGEKRRYDHITPKPSDEETTNTCCFKNFNGNNGESDNGRETLVAARRQPVKLIIHNPSGVRRSQPLSTPGVRANGAGLQGESPPYHPVKRGRLNSSLRPSLDFEKMRERMVNSAWSQSSQDSDCSVSEQENERRKREDESGNAYTLDGRRCTRHQVVRCQHADCTFRPVEVDNIQSNGFSSHLGDETD